MDPAMLFRAARYVQVPGAPARKSGILYAVFARCQNPEVWRVYEDEGILYVPEAGEVRYRLKT